MFCTFSLLSELHFNTEYDIILQYGVYKTLLKVFVLFQVIQNHFPLVHIFHILLYGFFAQQFASSHLKREILCKLSLSCTYQGLEGNSYNQIATFICK